MRRNLKCVTKIIYSLLALIALKGIVCPLHAYQTSTINDDFPQSYNSYIIDLKAKHPNWDIKAFHTHLDWNSVINSESSGTYSRISNSAYSDAWKRLDAQGSSSYNASGYVLASRSAVAYVMDPRNFLNDSGIFQFRVIDKDIESDTEESVNGIAHGTPMANTSYKSIIKEVGYSKNISPNFIITRIRQETGCDIVNNGSINGKNSKYPGYYNFFNIGAFDSSSNTVQSGINLAYSKGWNTPQKAIEGGMDYFKEKYLKYGQNTVYFQKFDVANPYGNATVMLSWQYMTNIAAPKSESLIMYNGLVRAGTLNNKYTFYIPVYDNMPSVASPMPSVGYYEDDNTKVYLDDPNTNASQDTFRIRSTADSSNSSNIVYELTQSADVSKKLVLTRIKKGIDTGWDYVEFTTGGKKVAGYVWNSYVFEYSYTKVESVSLSNVSKTIKVGDTYKLTATVKPDNAKFKDVIWSSANTSIATVDENGNVKGIAPGSVIIYAKTSDQGKIAECVVTVTDKSPVISLDKESYNLLKDKSTTFNVTIENTDLSEYETNIEDETVAKIEDGKIKALKEGTTKIIVNIKGTGVKCEATIKVTELKENDIVIGDSLKVDSGVISKINPETKAQDLISKVTSTYNIELRNMSGKVLESNEIIGTGTTVNIKDGDGNIVATYTVVIYGDVTGDGKISPADYVRVKNKIIGNEKVEGCFETASDVTGDSNISPADYVKIKNHILKVENIIQ